jgi:hypothetical protein
MSMNTRLACLTALAAGLGLPLATTAQPAPVHLPADTVTVVAGLKTACTGIGAATRQDPRWNDFPVRIEVAAPSGDFLGEETLVVAPDKGPPLLAVSCNSPWVLLGLSPGAYRVTASSGHWGPKTISIRAPAHGQARFLVHFP